jgi:hypothetical protein
METRETIALRKAIENWIGKNTNTVIQAQKLAQKIMNYGLIDVSKNLPFQILPTTISDSTGDPICKLYINLESPLYGFFSIELEKENCAITCPSTYHTDYFVSTYEDCDGWIDSLNSEMDIFYQLSSAAEENQIVFCNNSLNEMLDTYKKLTDPEINSIKNQIESCLETAIVSNNFFAMAKDAKKDFSKALLLPQSWVVFKSLDDLPDDDEDIENYVDEQKTNELFEKLVQFQKQESYYSAPIYLAQRICLQSGMDVKGYSLTEDSWVVAAISAELGEFVLPPIDMDRFEVTLM